MCTFFKFITGFISDEPTKIVEKTLTGVQK